MKTEGIILKGIGGFYYVEAAEKIYECRARGVFRKSGVTPLVGDYVEITADVPGVENTIDTILTRKNFLKRPPIANIDKLFIIISMCEPSPNFLLTDRLTAYAEKAGIEPVIVVTKTDLVSADNVVETYLKTGFKTFEASGITGKNISLLKDELVGCVSSFAGNSGVGKSTLLNAVDETWKLKTGQISEKLGRGRHTTRHVELLKISGGYVADTPGFSSFESDFEKNDFIPADELQYYFRDFQNYISNCKFSSCSHVADKGCAVVEAVKCGEISSLRHESYTALYNEVKDIKEWQLKQK